MIRSQLKSVHGLGRGWNNLVTVTASEEGNWELGGGGGESLLSLCAFGFAVLGIRVCIDMYDLLQEKQVLNCLYSVQWAKPLICFTWIEWSLSKNNPKPSAVKFSCLSLCEAERRKGKKGLFVFLGGRKRGTADHIRALIKRRQVTCWRDRVSARLCLGGLPPDRFVALGSKT